MVCHENFLLNESRVTSEVEFFFFFLLPRLNFIFSKAETLNEFFVHVHTLCRNKERERQNTATEILYIPFCTSRILKPSLYYTVGKND